MKIGIDLDGVVFDSEKAFRVYCELYDIFTLRRNSLINNSEVRFQERYKWSNEEQKDFMNKYYVPVVSDSPFMPGVKEVLRLLKDEGFCFYIVTARGGVAFGGDEKVLEITKKRINEELNIFDKCFFGVVDKADLCLKEKIDVMIDDNISIIKSVASKNIKTIYLKDAPSYDLKESEYIKVLYNWGEIYRYLKNLREEK